MHRAAEFRNRQAKVSVAIGSVPLAASHALSMIATWLRTGQVKVMCPHQPICPDVAEENLGEHGDYRDVG